jgi:hypothetical protein
MRLFLFLYLCFCFIPLVHADDNWFETDVYQGSLTVRGGVFEGGDQLQSVQVESNFLFGSELSAQLSQLEIDDQQEDQWILAIETASFEQTSLRISYAESERDDDYSFDNLGLMLSYSISSFDFQLVFASGNMDVAVSDIPPVLASILTDIGAFSADQTQYGVGVAYYADVWGWSLAYDDFDLDREQTVSDVRFGDLDRSQRAALREYFAEQETTSLGRGLINSLAFAGFSVNQQLSAGLDETLYFDTYRSFDNGWVVSGGLELFRTLFNEGSNTAAFVNVDVPVSKRFALGGLIGADDNSKSAYTELSLRYSW